MKRLSLGGALALVLLLLMACGGDDKPDARALLAETLKKTGEQRTVSATLTTKIDGGGEKFDIVQDVVVEPAAQKGYVLTTADGESSELVLDGRRAWIRENWRGAWRETTAQSLGIKPESLTATADTSKAAKTVVHKPEVTREGRRLYHVRAVIDPKAQGITEIAPALSTLALLDTRDVFFDYYIGKGDRLLYGVEISVEATKDGETLKVHVEAIYSDYNRPAKYPADLPR